tara:strand:+ start:86 stop:328 length:243 start_codon:yes stop_codon:yes gene_type:complete
MSSWNYSGIILKMQNWQIIMQVYQIFLPPIKFPVLFKVVITYLARQSLLPQSIKFPVLFKVVTTYLGEQSLLPQSFPLPQ